MRPPWLIGRSPGPAGKGRPPSPHRCRGPVGLAAPHDDGHVVLAGGVVIQIRFVTDDFLEMADLAGHRVGGGLTPLPRRARCRPRVRGVDAEVAEVALRTEPRCSRRGHTSNLRSEGGWCRSRVSRRPRRHPPRCSASAPVRPWSSRRNGRAGSGGRRGIGQSRSPGGRAPAMLRPSLRRGHPPRSCRRSGSQPRWGAW